jgi:hypothetical protein
MNVVAQNMEQAARRAYELGRLRAGALHAVPIAMVVSTLGVLTAGRGVILWALAPWLAWTILEWRGGALRTGGVRGILAGAALLVLPMTWLRPCCTPGMAIGDGACCTRPSMCLLAGAIVGVLAAAVLPRATKGRLLESAVGLGIGMLSVAAFRCAVLLEGDIGGIVFGLTAGVAAASALRAFAEARATRTR